jgi:hypothetical protein
MHYSRDAKGKLHFFFSFAILTVGEVVPLSSPWIDYYFKRDVAAIIIEHFLLKFRRGKRLIKLFYSYSTA